jgi:toxin ParE1/3/4
MKVALTLRARADADLDAAVAFSAHEAPEQASKILTALETTLAQIARRPGSGSPRYAEFLSMPGLRVRAVTGFPYLVFSLEQRRDVVVLRLLHERRDLPTELD